MARRTRPQITPVESETYEQQRNPVATNRLKLRIDDLHTFKPLTENQKKFFDAYRMGDYFIALHGVAGTGKTFCALYKAIEEV